MRKNQDLNGRLQDLQPMLCLSMLGQIIRTSEGINEQTLGECGINLPNPYFSVLLVHVGGGKENEARAVLGVSVMGILESWFAERFPCYALECATDTISIFTQCRCACNPRDRSGGPAICGAEHAFCPSAGLGGTVRRLEEVHTSYQQAQEALDYAVAWHVSGITRFEDLSPTGNCVFSQMCEQELAGKLRLGDAEGALALLERFFREAQGEPLAQVQIMSFSIMNACLRLLTEWKLPAAAMLEEVVPNLRLAQLSSPELLQAELSQMIRRLASIAQQLQEHNYTAVGSDVIRLLEEQYQDNTLSLTTVAAKLDLNASYLSHIFKQQAGENFVNVLNEIRLKNACQL